MNYSEMDFTLQSGIEKMLNLEWFNFKSCYYWLMTLEPFFRFGRSKNDIISTVNQVFHKGDVRRVGQWEGDLERLLKSRQHTCESTQLEIPPPLQQSTPLPAPPHHPSSSISRSKQCQYSVITSLQPHFAKAASE